MLGVGFYQVLGSAAEEVDGCEDVPVLASAVRGIGGQDCSDERQEGDEDEEAHGGSVQWSSQWTGEVG